MLIQVVCLYSGISKSACAMMYVHTVKQFDSNEYNLWAEVPLCTLPKKGKEKWACVRMHIWMCVCICECVWTCVNEGMCLCVLHQRKVDKTLLIFWFLKPYLSIYINSIFFYVFKEHFKLKLLIFSFANV